MVKVSQKKENYFSENLRNYIVGNNMSYEEFANKLNLVLISKNHSGKTCYIGKDIRSFAYRSCPRDLVAMAMIAKIIGKELSELITKKFEIEELCRKNDSEIVLTDKFKSQLQQLSADEYTLLVIMVATAEIDKEKDQIYKICDIGIFYNSGIDVRSVLYLNNGKVDVNLTTWSWGEYGNRISDYNNDEMFAIECEIRDRYLEKFENLGLVKDYYCTSNSLSEEEFDSPPDKAFSLDVFFNLSEVEYNYLLNELKSCSDEMQ